MARTPARQGPQEQTAGRAYQKRSREQREAPSGGESTHLRSAISTGQPGKQILDVNGIGVNFTFVNAIDAVNGEHIDDQGEYTDPSLDFAAMANTKTAAGADQGAQPTSPQARTAARNGEVPPSFQTPTISDAPTTDIQQAQVPAPPNSNIILPNAEFQQDPAPKSWYLIIGGHLRGFVLETTIARFVRTSSGMQIARLRT
eukprot:4242926-Pleurochrysis_carterae.AAC.1